MANTYTPQLMLACERWLQDTVLIDLLKAKKQQALEFMGNTTDVNTMLRAQGVYKSFMEMFDFIEGGAIAADVERVNRKNRSPSPL